MGGAYGTAKAGQGIMAMGIRSPELIMKNIIPVVMAGVLGIYGLMYVLILRETTEANYNFSCLKLHVTICVYSFQVLR